MNEKIDNKILGIFLLPIYTFIAFFAFFIFGLNSVYAVTLNKPDAISINNGSSTALKTCNNSNICELYNSNDNGLHASVIYNYNFKANFTYYFQYNATVVMGYGSTLLNPNFQYYNFRAAMYGPNLGEYLTCTTNVSNYSVSNYDGYWDNNYIGHNVYYDVTFNCSYKPPNDGAMVSFSMLSNNSNPNTFINISNPDMTITTDSTEIIITNQDKNQQQTNERLENIDNSINETKDYLEDDTPPESDISSLGNVDGLLPAGPLDSLLNIPAKFLSVIVSSFGSQCRPLSGDFIFDSTLTIPCFGESFYSRVPNGLMIFINLIPGVFILIVYFKYLYKKVERATSMDTSTDDMWGAI